MNDFSKGLRVLRIVRVVKKPFQYISHLCEQWEVKIINKHSLY